MNDVIIQKTSGGLGRREPSEDMVSGLITNGIAVVGGLQLGTVYNLKTIDELKALKVDADYDTANTTLLFHHVSEFFRMNPNGELFLLCLAQATTLSQMLDKDIAANATKLILEAEGRIRQLGACLNPANGWLLVDGDDDGIHDDVLVAVGKAQALYNAQSAQHRLQHIFIELRGDFSDESVMPSFRTTNPSVSVFAGNDRAIANSNARFNHYADIGTLLGAVSAAKVNESIAWVEKFNCQSVADQVLLAPGLPGNVLLKTMSDASQASLNTKGIITFRTHVGIAGVYFNNSHTCDAASSDFAYIPNNRTIDKGIRLIRTALLPKLASPLKVDSSGKLSGEVCKKFERIGYNAIEQMVKDEECSSVDVFVDPDQDVLSTSELQVKFDIIPTGSADKITVIIGFKNPNNN